MLDRLRAQVLVRDDVHALDRLRQERACAADREQVDGLVVLQRLLYHGTTSALADDDLQPLLEQARRKRIEPHRGRRASRADDAAGPRR